MAFFISLLGTILLSLVFFIFFNRILTLKLKEMIISLSNKSDQLESGDIIKFFIEFQPILLKLIEKANVIAKHQKNNAIMSIASQVSHDIRSPLAALNMIAGQITNIPEEKRILLRSSIQRINDISNNLLVKSKKNSEIINSDLISESLNLTIEHIPASIEILVSEKRIQYRNKINVNIESNIANGYLAFAKIDLREFKRILSNLINNSVEAFSNNSGQVEVIVRTENNKSLVIIKDNGKGIPPHVLARLGEQGFSYGKEGKTENGSGSGLGIYHAKKTLELMGADFSIESIENSGTTITLTFPEATHPAWFVSNVDLIKFDSIVILDDDASIHQIWKGRFDSLKITQKLYHFANPIEFRKFYEEGFNKNYDLSRTLFLMDYELLGYEESGLDLIEKLKITNAYLVTSRYEEENIKFRCEKLNIKLIPKGLAAYVPIETDKTNELFDYILIDDDELIRMTWEMSAKTKGKKIKCFKSDQEFLKVIDTIDLETILYVDSSLGDDVIGEEFAKTLYEKYGFKNIYMATGYEPEKFSGMNWIKGVVGKGPPG